MYCLDTDFLVGLLRKDESATAFAKKLGESGEGVSVTPIAVAELFTGAYLSEHPENVELVQDLIANLDLLAFDATAAQVAGQTIAALQKQGQPIGDFDTLIAAVAMRHNKTLVTRNVKHFQRVPNLKVVEW